jgi:hypothetical protein
VGHYDFSLDLEELLQGLFVLVAVYELFEVELRK